MDIRQLRYFAEVAGAKGIKDGAARLHISQSSVSRRIQDLEKELGTALFERRIEGAQLTDAGRRLLVRTKAIFQEMELAKLEVASRGAPAGAVTIGSSPAMSHLVLAELTERVAQAFPQIGLQFVEGAQYALMQGLDIGSIDVALMVSPRDVRNCAIEPLVEEALYWVFKPNRRIRPRSVTLAGVGGRPLILFPRPSTNRDLLDKAAEAGGTQLDVRWEVADLATQKDFIRRGLADGILPMSAIHGEVRERTLTAIRIENVMLTRSLVVRSARGQSSAATAVARTVRAIFHDMVERRAFGGSMSAAQQAAADQP